MEALNPLKKSFEAMNIENSQELIEKFRIYMEGVLEWNEKVNLTTITDPDEFVIKHFIDSNICANYPEYINAVKIIDVGTGAGFPGIPLKIVRPDLKITLVDSLNKIINFLNIVIDELELKNITTVHSRIEDFGKNKQYREKFDYVTARAVANLAVLYEYLLPITKVGGQAIVMKGSNVKEELDDGKKAIGILGGKLNCVDEFVLPDSDIFRNVVVIDKIKNTPGRFPRKAGVPSKEPIK